MIAEIRQQIKNKLDALLVNVATPRAVVYDYFESNPSGFPAVAFDMTEHNNEFISNVENLQVMVFKIGILVDNGDADGRDERDATILLDTLTDDIIVAFENDFSLGNSVDYCVPTISSRSVVQMSNGVAKYQEIKLTIKKSRVVN